jgi:hypothetical protein
LVGQLVGHLQCDRTHRAISWCIPAPHEVGYIQHIR